MLEAGRPKIAEDLGGGFIGELPHRLEFDDQLPLDHHVGDEISQDQTVLVDHSQRESLLNVEAELASPVPKRNLVYLFTVPVSQEAMGCEGGAA